MLHKTKGIVLQSIKFKESSLIVRIFTQDFGLRSYIVNGVRKKNAKTHNAAFYQPLTLLDMLVYQKENANIQRIAEVHLWEAYHSIPFSVTKQAQALFLTEVLNRTLKQESAELGIFEFVAKSLLHLDRQKENYDNFHLIFLLQYSRFLGFGIDSVTELDLQIRQFIPLDNIESQIIDMLLTCEYVDLIKLQPDFRRKALDVILMFYRLHIENFGELNSVKVLREMLA